MDESTRPGSTGQVAPARPRGLHTAHRV